MATPLQRRSPSCRCLVGVSVAETSTHLDAAFAANLCGQWRKESPLQRSRHESS